MADQTSRFAAIEITNGQAAAMEDLREAAAILEKILLEVAPDSRERSLALTSLEQAIMWANKGISRHGYGSRV